MNKSEMIEFTLIGHVHLYTNKHCSAHFKYTFGAHVIDSYVFYNDTMTVPTSEQDMLVYALPWSHEQVNQHIGDLYNKRIQ